MKTLILTRHAKSSMEEKHKDDWDRPLNKRGRKNVSTIAKVFTGKEALPMPQIILSSAAVRAHQTTELLVEELGYRGDIHYLASLYKGEVETYLSEIQHMPDSAECVLVVGHNPVLEGFLQLATGKVEALPTASLACLHTPVESWKDFNFEVGSELVYFWKPKD